jgi:hypothetical protein
MMSGRMDSTKFQPALDESQRRRRVTNDSAHSLPLTSGGSKLPDQLCNEVKK